QLVGEFPISPVNPNSDPAKSWPRRAFAQVNKGATNSQGGTIDINTPKLILRDGAKIQTAVFGEGKAGALIIRAADIDIADTQQPNYFPTAINAGVTQTLIPNIDDRLQLRGAGGDLLLETDRLKIQGGNVTVASFGQGDAGNITIRGYNGRANAERIEIANSPIETQWRQEGAISAANEGIGQAGNLSIAADRILLNGGQIQTRSLSGRGGNIDLTLTEVLSLRSASRINAEAGRLAAGGGDGGNLSIRIPGGLLVAVPQENNDINANAFAGSGGRVTIQAERILGIAPLSRQELAQRLSALGFDPQDPRQLDPVNLLTSDITAVSRANPVLDGEITIETLDLDPSRGLASLPTAPTDPSDRIDQSCAASSGATSSRFTVTGRGGLPTSPDDLTSPDTLSRLVQMPASAQVVPKVGRSRDTIIEAQEAVRLPNGKIRLVAQVAKGGEGTDYEKNWRRSKCPGFAVHREFKHYIIQRSAGGETRAISQSILD
ncbi:MAG: S-layer family protein, partial [Leptolyngbyaceae cyanobacterium CSU_1_3]|nr:S-layer family protein [Leptolyngbyaceae cyanobacterium CSU_1_3]